MNQIIIDTNIILRFLLKDHPKLSPKAREIVLNYQLYLDEIIVAESIWVLTSTYDRPKDDVVDLLQSFVSLEQIINPRKNLIIKTLNYYSQHNLSYIDCWLLALSQSTKIPLKTQDKKLAKIQKHQ